MTATHGAGTALRSLVVLEALAGMEQPTSLPALAARLGAPTSPTYRALRALQRAGFVDHVGRQGYRIGTRAMGLGALLGPWPELRALVRPVLTRLAVRASLTTRLHLRSGHDRVLLLAATAPHEHRPPSHTRIGERSPLTRGCSGRVMLAHLATDEVPEVLQHRPVSDERALRSELGRIRDNGYAVSHANNNAGRNGIAVVLRSPLAVTGALSLTGDENAIDEAGLRALAGTLSAAATELAGPLETVVGPAASAHRPALDAVDPRSAPH